jgi:hypothetical protein
LGGDLGVEDNIPMSVESTKPKEEKYCIIEAVSG